MENLDYFILDLALILVVASFVTIIFRRIKQPVVLGYIVAGFLISPNFKWLPTVISSGDIGLWADIGIIFLMLGIGLEFNLHKVAQVGGSAVITALTVIAGMITLGYSAGQLMGFGVMNSIFLGCMLSMSSTMIVVKTFEEQKLKKQSFAGVVIGALVIEDLAGIFMMIVLTTISVSKSFSGVQMAEKLGMLLMMLVLMLALGVFIIPSLLKRISHLLTDELLLIFALASCLLMVVISVWIGFSEALGAFLAGSILAGTVKAETIEHMVQPIKDLFGAVFFTSVGMMIQPEILVKYWLHILIISILVAFGQMFFSCIGCIASGKNLKTSVKAGSAMCQVGEFSFILASLGMNLGVMDEFLYPLIVCVSILTTFTTPIFVRNSDKIYRFLNKTLPVSLKERINTYSSSEKGSSIDKDWKSYLTVRIPKIVIGSAGCLAVYFGFIRFLEPMLTERHGLELPGRMILLVSMLALMSPFVYLIAGRGGRGFIKLWYKARVNRPPLLGIWILSIFLGSVFVTIALNRYIIKAPFALDILAAALLVMLMLKSDMLKSKFKNLETRFFVNLNERIIEREKLERSASSNKIWIDEKMQMVEFVLEHNNGKEYIRDLISNRAFGCMIVSIFRREGGLLINFPRANETLQEGDILTVIGPEEGLSAYIALLRKNKKIKEVRDNVKSLKEYLYFQMFDDDISMENQLMCCALRPLKKEDYICGKTLKDSKFIARFGGYVIAVERQGIQILSPENTEVFREGDTVWCIGTQEMVEKLDKAGILML